MRFGGEGEMKSFGSAPHYEVIAASAMPQKMHTCAADLAAQFDFRIPPDQPSRIGCTRVGLRMPGSQRR
jgi:hypothetical protein